jgi:hypothetical protein
MPYSTRVTGWELDDGPGVGNTLRFTIDGLDQTDTPAMLSALSAIELAHLLLGPALRPEPVSSLVSPDDGLRRPVPPRRVEQSFEPRGVKRGQVCIQSEQGIATGQLLTVAESKFGGHVGWVEVHKHA